MSTQLDANQVIKAIYDEINNRIRTDASVTASFGDLEVTMRSDEDSVAIGNVSHTNFVEVTSNSELKVKETNIDVLLSTRASTAKQDTGNASLASIDSKLTNGTDIGDVTVNNASGAGAVNIQDGGNSITVDQPTASNLNAQVVGNVASSVADSGNPVKVAAVYNSTLPTPSTGQRIDLQSNLLGEIRARATNSYLNVIGNATTVVKSGAGILSKIIINNGQNSSIITIYDNTSATGTKIGTPAILGINTNVMTTLHYDCKFNTGLTIVTSGSTTTDITILYQ